MRAVPCKTLGPPETLTVEEVAARPLAAGEVRLATTACGVNCPDTLIIAGTYRYEPELPFSPGGEVSGRIAEPGPGVEGRSLGEAVIAMTGWGGFASGRIPRLPANPALLKGSPAVGVFWDTFAKRGTFAKREPAVNAWNLHSLFRLHAEGRIEPPVGKACPGAGRLGSARSLRASRDRQTGAEGPDSLAPEACLG